MMLSLLPLGVVPQGAVSKMAPPSTAAVLMTIMGKWGSIIMNVGVIIAILSSWLIWTVMLTELPYAAAKDGTFPKVFTKENKKEAPSFSLSCIYYCNANNINMCSLYRKCLEYDVKYNKCYGFTLLYSFNFILI